jgi:hypothetical protein
MIKAAQLTKLTRDYKDKIAEATQEVIRKNHDNIENTLLQATKECTNSTVYTFSKMYDLEPAGIKTSEQRSIFSDEVFKYFKSLGFQVRSWVTWTDNIAFQIEWLE